MSGPQDMSGSQGSQGMDINRYIPQKLPPVKKKDDDQGVEERPKKRSRVLTTDQMASVDSVEQEHQIQTGKITGKVVFNDKGQKITFSLSPSTPALIDGQDQVQEIPAKSDKNPWFDTNFVAQFYSVMQDVLKVHRELHYKEAQVEIQGYTITFELAKSNAERLKQLADLNAQEKENEAISSFCSAGFACQSLVGYAGSTKLAEQHPSVKKMDQEILEFTHDGDRVHGQQLGKALKLSTNETNPITGEKYPLDSNGRVMKGPGEYIRAMYPGKAANVPPGTAAIPSAAEYHQQLHGVGGVAGNAVARGALPQPQKVEGANATPEQARAAEAAQNKLDKMYSQRREIVTQVQRQIDSQIESVNKLWDGITQGVIKTWNSKIEQEKGVIELQKAITEGYMSIARTYFEHSGQKASEAANFYMEVVREIAKLLEANRRAFSGGH